jgi:type VI secretion system secreted protein VgrG
VQISGGGEDSGSSSDSSSDTESSSNSWISIELKDKKGHPIPNEGYEIKLPDGSISSGTLDQRGRARVEGIPGGQCEVRFPRLHNSEWRKA